jgi:hypothetical protein
MAILTDEKIEPSGRYEVISRTRPEHHSPVDYQRPENANEIIAYIEKKHRHNGAKALDLKSKLLTDDPKGLVYEYEPNEFYNKILSFLKKHHGVHLPKHNKKEPPGTLMFYHKPLFSFANLVEVVQCYPYDSPDDDFLMVTNDVQVLYAYSSGYISVGDI